MKFFQRLPFTLSLIHTNYNILENELTSKLTKFLFIFTDRNDSRPNYQQNRGGHQQNSYQQRQGQSGRNDNQGRYNNAAPPATYNQRGGGYQQQQRQRDDSFTSGQSSYQNNRASQGSYSQWKEQRGGTHGQRGGQQQGRGGYQRYNDNQQQSRQFGNKPQDKVSGPPGSNYGGSYSR